MTGRETPRSVDEVAAAVALPRGALLIGDEWCEDGAAGTFEHVNPATGAVQGTLPLAGAADVDAAVGTARAAAPGWRATPPAVKREILLGLASLIRANASELGVIATLESGSPIAVSDRMVLGPAEWFAYYAGLGRQAHRRGRADGCGHLRLHAARALRRGRRHRPVERADCSSGR